MRILYFYQSVKTDGHTLLQNKDVMEDVTDVLLSSLHFGRDDATGAPYVHLNDNPPERFVTLLRDVAAAADSIKFHIMIGGAGGGDGLFAATLRKLCERLPTTEETSLEEAADREAFLARVLAYRRLRDLFDGDWKIADLVEHHTRQKLLLMAQSPDLCSRLGRLVAEAVGDEPANVESAYRLLTMEAFEQKATAERHSNALEHMRGYLRKTASEADYAGLGKKISSFRDGELELAGVLDDFRRLVKNHSVDYLSLQVYLEPQPAELLAGQEN